MVNQQAPSTLESLSAMHVGGRATSFQYSNFGARVQIQPTYGLLLSIRTMHLNRPMVMSGKRLT